MTKKILIGHPQKYGNMKMEKLGKYCKIISGYAFKSNDLSEGTEIPVIKIGNISNGDDVITDSSTQYVSSDFLSIDEKYHIKKGDVLISLTGSHINQPNSMVGRSCRNFSDTEFLLNQRAGKVIPNENADKNYLYYLLNTESFKYSICNRAYGAANQANVSPSDIENIKWNFPALPTQQKIASILSAYDDLIQNYKKQIQALQTAASELYKEWFVRFRFPGYQNTKFENGIPEGWKVEKLGTLANISTGKCNREDAEEDGIYPLFDRSQEIKKSNEWIKDCEAIIVPGEGTSFIPRYYKGKFNLHQRCYCVEPKYSNFGKFLFYVLMLNRKYFLSVATGATVPSLRYNNFASMKFILPEISLCNNFNKLADSVFEKIDNLQQQITNLTQQRDLLLPRLMSGKLEVK